MSGSGSGINWLGGPASGGDLNTPKKIDPKWVGPIVVLVVAIVFTIIGDRAAFVREPDSWVGFFGGSVVGGVYLYIEDRLASIVIAFLVFLAFFGCLFLAGFQVIERTILEPIAIKRMLETKKRQKEIINKYGDKSL